MPLAVLERDSARVADSLRLGSWRRSGHVLSASRFTSVTLRQGRSESVRTGGLRRGGPKSTRHPLRDRCHGTRPGRCGFRQPDRERSYQAAVSVALLEEPISFEWLLHHRKHHVQVTFIPPRPDQIEALTAGVVDMIAYGVIVTPEREQQVAFSILIFTDVKQIVVTGKEFGPVSSLQDMGGEEDLR